MKKRSISIIESFASVLRTWSSRMGLAHYALTTIPFPPLLLLFRLTELNTTMPHNRTETPISFSLFFSLILVKGQCFFSKQKWAIDIKWIRIITTKSIVKLIVEEMEKEYNPKTKNIKNYWIIFLNETIKRFFRPFVFYLILNLIF